MVTSLLLVIAVNHSVSGGKTGKLNFGAQRLRIISEHRLPLGITQWWIIENLKFEVYCENIGYIGYP